MDCATARWLGCTLLVVSTLSGCLETTRPTKYLGDAQLQHYKDVATEVEYSDVQQPTPDTVKFTEPPHRIRHPREDEIWDMSLVEALHLAVANSEIIRSDAAFGNRSNSLLTAPSQVPSIYDPAIQSSGVLFGQRGVEAALSDFDALFNTQMTWNRNENRLNTSSITGNAGQTAVREQANFQTQLQKQFAYGAQLTLNHNWNYEWNNANENAGGGPGAPNLFNSVYQGSVGVNYRQPLWAGSGPTFTRIAGPNVQRVRGTNVTGVRQGVVIARINTDISIADFEADVRNLLRDVETAYWDLYLAYRTYHSEVVARDSALRTWQEVEARAAQGQEGGGAAEEAQARDTYYENRARAQSALADIYATETRLRRLIGLPVNDGRVIRPSDKPVSAEFLPDWELSLTEALTQRPELRRQKWNIKSLQLQLQAAESLNDPRLDFISGYQVNALGDRLLSDPTGDNEDLESAYDELTDGNETGWNLGFEFEMPLGFRAANSQVRNIELRLAKARAALGAQELEISHELANAFQELDRWYATAQTNFNRREAAAERLEAVQAEYQAGRATIDLLLRSQVSLARATVAYYRSLVEYNQAIADLHFRKGTLLEHNNVRLAEDLWKPGAYKDALRRAWARSHAIEGKGLHTEPAEFEAGRQIGQVELASPIDGPNETEESETSQESPESDDAKSKESAEPKPPREDRQLPPPPSATEFIDFGDQGADSNSTPAASDTPSQAPAEAPQPSRPPKLPQDEDVPRPGEWNDITTGPQKPQPAPKAGHKQSARKSRRRNDVLDEVQPPRQGTDGGFQPPEAGTGETGQVKPLSKQDELDDSGGFRSLPE